VRGGLEEAIEKYDAAFVLVHSFGYAREIKSILMNTVHINRLTGARLTAVETRVLSANLSPK
jgi:hypothetical protein